MQSFEALKYTAAKNPSSTSRILYDVACKVCQDNSSGKHYGIFACDGCAGFFKRSIRRNRQYVCKGKVEGNCVVDKTHRNQCRACRLRKCIEEGMNKDAVQHERGPRNSTLARQMLYNYRDSSEAASISPGLDLTSSRISSTSGGNADESPDRNLPPNHPGSFLFFPQIVPPAPPMTLMNNPEFICESVASVLFMNMKWASSVAAFTNLPLDDQRILVKKSWPCLFTLSTAQYLPPIDLNPLLVSLIESNESKVNHSIEETGKFQETITKLKQLQVDAYEYACMRAIMLFKAGLDKMEETGGNSSLKEVTTIRERHDDSQEMLKNYVNVVYSVQPHRLGKLHQLMLSISKISASVIEDLFFRRHIGPASISTIIYGLYKPNHYP